MNLLEAFYYTFAADASGLDRGLTDAEKKAEKLKNSVSNADAAAEKLGTSFLSLAKAGVGLLGVTLTLGGIKALALGTAETTSELGKQARQMNVNVSTLDAWRKTITESGGDAEAFTRTLGNMAQRFRDPEAALLRYSKALGGMSAFKAQRIGKMIGLDEGTIELLRKGKVSVEELLKKQKEQGVITKEQVAMTDKFNQDLRTLKMSFTDLKTNIGMGLIPTFQYLLDKWNALSKWTSENKDFVKGFFIAIAAIIVDFYLPAMLKAAAATIAATWPILLIVAAVVAVAAAFALAYDDVMNFLAGNDSVIGELSKKWPWIGELVLGLVAELKNLWAQIVAVGDAFILMVTNPIQFLKNFGAEIRELLDLLFGEGAGDSIFSAIADSVGAAWKGIKILITSVVGLAMKGFEAIGNAWKKVKGWFGAGEEEVNNAKNAAAGQSLQGWETPGDLTYGGKEQLAQASASSVTTMTSSSITNSKAANKNINNRVDKIEVITQATDAEGIARDIGSEYGNAMSQYADGLEI
ncbi:Uncharacterised protein [Yersinia pseudotuberculosis]|uniref:hypothetical protein n=1 Tax=Yersinia pseudotuberculosis TaxID=633 RepID=UPI0005AD24A2|nr:hypothetical protein [Yersinia pseudotuberculosis]AJK18090.1 hypothetical protein BZ19_885 [Yersinia pseudotuberculosis str. PA3606]CNK58357.1 Uncharacterised protein [Yersinia pseudotuberculosis]